MVVVNPILPFSGRVASRLPLWHKLWSVASLRLWQEAGNTVRLLCTARNRLLSPRRLQWVSRMPCNIEHLLSCQRDSNCSMKLKVWRLLLLPIQLNCKTQWFRLMKDEICDWFMGYLTINWYTYSSIQRKLHWCVKLQISYTVKAAVGGVGNHRNNTKLKCKLQLTIDLQIVFYFYLVTSHQKMMCTVADCRNQLHYLCICQLCKK